MHYCFSCFFFFFNDTATTEIYTLSLHDALPISRPLGGLNNSRLELQHDSRRERSEEHTSELQSHVNLVCRLLLEKKKKKIQNQPPDTHKCLVFIRRTTNRSQ